MNYREIKWCGYTWRSQERWGDRTEGHPKQVRDGKLIKMNDDGSIALYISKNSKGDYASGLLSCVEKLSYGTYSLDVMLPKGNNLWPAFWMWSYTTWPPEIDIFEGYSGKNHYGKGKLLHKVCPNVHYGDNNENHKSVGAKDTLGILTNIDGWITFKCVYKKNSIKIFYNNILVYFVTSNKVMKWFNSHKEQNVIINTGVTLDFSDDDLKTLDRPMILKNFKYIPA